MSDPLNTRKIVLGVKDASGAYIKQEAAVNIPAAPPAVPIEVEPAKGEIDLDDLLARAMRIMYREVKALELASHGGTKLNKDQASELRENLRLLMDLKKREKDLLDRLSDDELEDLERKKKSNDLAQRSPTSPKKARKAKV